MCSERHARVFFSLRYILLFAGVGYFWRKIPICLCQSVRSSVRSNHKEKHCSSRFNQPYKKYMQKTEDVDVDQLIMRVSAQNPVKPVLDVRNADSVERL